MENWVLVFLAAAMAIAIVALMYRFVGTGWVVTSGKCELTEVAVVTVATTSSVSVTGRADLPRGTLRVLGASFRFKRTGDGIVRIGATQDVSLEHGPGVTVKPIGTTGAVVATGTFSA